MPAKSPSEIAVRMYNVGFGDCFLLTFVYAGPGGTDVEKHMLVDFGSTQGPKRGGPSMAEVASLLQEHSNEHIDVVVATHRHKDHISGFGSSATDKVMKTFAPTTVIRPWTDNPKIAANANAPSKLDADSKRLVRRLAAHDAWMRQLATVDVKGSTGVRRETVDLADDQLPNPNAIKRLDEWSEEDRGLYVKAGDVVRLTELPGVTLQILGPPTLAQVPGLINQTETSSEFWAQPPEVAITDGTVVRSDDLIRACQALADPSGYGEARWILDRLTRSQLQQLFQVVRSFDDALNNTSIIMIVRTNDRTLLLSGDAQIENWSHSLGLFLRDKPTKAGKQLQAALADVDLYKVGHHGSRNATPKSLFELWTNGARSLALPPVTLLSTLPGKHGKSADTAVPKDNLSDALRDHTTLFRTDRLRGRQTFYELRVGTRGRDAFQRV